MLALLCPEKYVSFRKIPESSRIFRLNAKSSDKTTKRYKLIKRESTRIRVLSQPVTLTSHSTTPSLLAIRYAHYAYRTNTKFREAESLIEADGWFFKSQRGSHCQYLHPYKHGKVTIPRHSGDIAMRTVQSIMEQAGLQVSERN
jgi:predicted RNA binding protein YcfA (HicA-like mRNA interferase family)